MKLDRVAVVILTWNNCKYTVKCLSSLEEQSWPHTVYVIDNASTDNTVVTVRERFPAAHIVLNEKNVGFAAGNNIGLNIAFGDGADAVLLLNNDTTLLPDTLECLVVAATEYPEAGIVTPLILSADPPHRIQAAGTTIDRWTGRVYSRMWNAPVGSASGGPQQVQGAMGCAILITRACFERIGGFNELLFLYFEDTEYSIRAGDAGFSIILVPRSRVFHHGSVSSGVKSSDVIYFMTRNGIVTMDRLRPLPAIVAAVRRLVIMLLMLCWMVRPPRGTARIRDICQGYRDARCRRLGPRDALAKVS